MTRLLVNYCRGLSLYSESEGLRVTRRVLTQAPRLLEKRVK